MAELERAACDAIVVSCVPLTVTSMSNRPSWVFLSYFCFLQYWPFLLSLLILRLDIFLVPKTFIESTSLLLSNQKCLPIAGQCPVYCDQWEDSVELAGWNASSHDGPGQPTSPCRDWAGLTNICPYLQWYLSFPSQSSPSYLIINISARLDMVLKFIVNCHYLYHDLKL